MAFDAGAITGRLILQGMGEFEVSMRRVQQSVRAAETESRRLPLALRAVEGAAASTARRILEMATAFGLATSATQAMGQAVTLVRDQFRRGLDAVEDFRATTVQIAAVLTSMARDPSPRAFGQNLEFAADAMVKLDLAAAKFLATGEQLRTAFQAFVQRGVIPVTDRDFDALGRITDAVVILTKGQDTSRQLFQEINDLVTGRVVPGMSRLAGFIQGNVADLRAWVEEHRRAGTLLPAIAQQLEGFRLAEGEILSLTSTWANTLETVFDLVRRRGFIQPYEDIRETLQRITKSLIDLRTGQLTPLAEEIARKINKAWGDFRTIALGTFEWLRANGPNLLLTLKDAFAGLGTVLNTVVVPPLRVVLRTLEQIGEAQRIARVIREAREMGFQPPPGITLGGEEHARLAQEFIARERERLNREFRERAFQMRGVPEFGGRLVPLPPDRPRRPAPTRPQPISPEDLEKIERGLQVLQDRLAAARGEGLRAEIDAVRRHADELLKLARDDAKRREEIIRARDALILELERKRARQVADLESQARQEEFRALGAHLDARTGRLEQSMAAEFQARAAALQRALDEELEAERDNTTAREAILRRAAARLRQLVDETYSAIIQRANQVRDQVLTLDRQIFEARRAQAQQLLSIEERIAEIRIQGLREQAETAGTPEASQQAEREIAREQARMRQVRLDAVREQEQTARRMRAGLDPVLDFDRIRQLNDDLARLAQERQQIIAEGLLEEAKAARERAKLLSEQGDVVGADLASRRAKELEGAAVAALRQAQDEVRTLGEEQIKLIEDVRQQRVSEWARIAQEYQEFVESSGRTAKAVAEQFTALARHIVKSTSDAVREAARQIATLTGQNIPLPSPQLPASFSAPEMPRPSSSSGRQAPTPPPFTSPASATEPSGMVVGGGRAVVIQGDLIFEIDVPEWVKHLDDLKRLIRDTASEFFSNLGRRSAIVQ